MGKLATMTLTGASGEKYAFNVYSRSDTFDPIGAVYFLTKRIRDAEGTGTHSWVYVGETDDLSDRPLNHHRKACFDRHGADSLLIRAEKDRTTRLAIEADLRAAYVPPCNQQ